MIVVLALVVAFGLAGCAAFLNRDETIAALCWGTAGVLAIMMGAA